MLSAFRGLRLATPVPARNAPVIQRVLCRAFSDAPVEQPVDKIHTNKRPMNSFFLYVREKRTSVTAALKAEDAKAGVTDVSRKLGEMWKALSQADKETYTAAAAKARAEFNKAYVDVPPSFPAEQTVKDPNKKKRIVKRALTAYNLFVKEYFTKVQKDGSVARIDKNDTGKQMAEAWATADKILWAGKAEEANRLVDAAKLSAEKES